VLLGSGRFFFIYRDMSYLLPHLDSGWAVDQAILTEEARVVVIRFGRDSNQICMQMDETLADIR
jgi:DIM1 family U5 snRNP protein